MTLRHELTSLIREWIAAKLWIWFLRITTPELFNDLVKSVEGKRLFEKTAKAARR